MKLPWKEDKEMKQKLEELEQKIEEVEEDRDKFKNKFEAEQERRSELATKKQKAEEKLNRLKDKYQDLKNKQDGESEEGTDEDEKEPVSTQLDFSEGFNFLKKMESVVSPEQDLVTVYSPTNVEDAEDFRGLKSSVSKNRFRLLQDEDAFIAFLDEEAFDFKLKTRPFFRSDWFNSENFLVGRALSFIEKEKIWVQLAAGETKIFKEDSGEFERIDTVKSRVDRDHSKGGFSQSRFERKRDEQIDKHLDQVTEVLEMYDEVYLLGERSLCAEVPGEYLGGFDPNKSPLESFYNFRLVK